MIRLSSRGLIGLVLVATCSIFSACGKSSSGSDPEENGEQVVTSTDPLSVKISSGELTGADVSFLPGSFKSGASIKLASAEQPKAISDLTELYAASPAMSVIATNEDGSNIESISKAMTLTIPMTDGARDGFLDVEKTDANICLVLAGADDKNYVWRGDAKDYDDVGRLLTAKSKVLGIFQLLYCGDLPMTGFIALDKDGEEAAE